LFFNLNEVILEPTKRGLARGYFISGKLSFTITNVSYKQANSLD